MITYARDHSRGRRPQLRRDLECGDADFRRPARGARRRARTARAELPRLTPHGNPSAAHEPGSRAGETRGSPERAHGIPSRRHQPRHPARDRAGVPAHRDRDADHRAQQPAGPRSSIAGASCTTASRCSRTCRSTPRGASCDCCRAASGSSISRSSCAVSAALARLRRHRRGVPRCAVVHGPCPARRRAVRAGDVRADRVPRACSCARVFLAVTEGTHKIR